MNVYPLEILDLASARAMQFRLVETVSRHFDGQAILLAGDYGLQPDVLRPIATTKVEAVLADFFGTEDACLVRGAGTGGIRSVLMAMLKPGQEILLHDAPLYPTTRSTVEAMGLRRVHVDLNDLEGVRQVAARDSLACALVQHSRQRIGDRYLLSEVVVALRSANPELLILVDENYAAMRVPWLGVQVGADVSTFSLFKLLGPEGLGCVLANRQVIGRMRELAYSGGTQVQGPEAMCALRGLVYAPVALAIQGEVVNEVVARLNQGEVVGIRRAFVANAQSRVALVELDRPQAAELLKRCTAFGAAGHPVGAESRYEIAPLFYRISGTLMEEDPELAARTIRINPNRAGSDLIIDILQKSLETLREEPGDVP